MEYTQSLAAIFILLTAVNFYCWCLSLSLFCFHACFLLILRMVHNAEYVRMWFYYISFHLSFVLFSFLSFHWVLVLFRTIIYCVWLFSLVNVILLSIFRFIFHFERVQYTEWRMANGRVVNAAAHRQHNIWELKLPKTMPKPKNEQQNSNGNNSINCSVCCVPNSKMKRKKQK